MGEEVLCPPVTCSACQYAMHSLLILHKHDRCLGSFLLAHLARQPSTDYAWSVPCLCIASHIQIVKQEAYKGKAPL